MSATDWIGEARARDGPCETEGCILWLGHLSGGLPHRIDERVLAAQRRRARDEERRLEEGY